MKDSDAISKQRAMQLFGSDELEHFEVGTTKGLQQIHVRIKFMTGKSI